MLVRYLKILLVAFVALMGIVYALQNVANLDAAFGGVASVLTMQSNEVYPSSLIPALTSPALIWIALWLIILGEAATGVVAAKGAWDLFSARSESAEKFDAAKTYAVAGCALGMVVWFGLFATIGGAFFQMWQHAVGAGSLNDALKFAIVLGVILLVVSAPDR